MRISDWSSDVCASDLFGEPLRLMVDIDPEARIVAMVPASAEGRLLLASTSGHGFVAQMSDVVAETRKGRNVVNLKPKAALAIARPIGVQEQPLAVVGAKRHTAVLPPAHVPARGTGPGRVRNPSSPG